MGRTVSNEISTPEKQLGALLRYWKDLGYSMIPTIKCPSCSHRVHPSETECPVCHGKV